MGEAGSTARTDAFRYSVFSPQTVVGLDETRRQTKHGGDVRIDQSLGDEEVLSNASREDGD